MPDYKYTFAIDPEEHAKVDAFIQEHRHPHRTAIGGYISFTFCSTAIGMVKSVRCERCNASMDASGDL